MRINGIKCSIAGNTGKHSQQKKETIIVEEDEGPVPIMRDSAKRRKN